MKLRYAKIFFIGLGPVFDVGEIKKLTFPPKVEVWKIAITGQVSETGLKIQVSSPKISINEKYQINHPGTYIKRFKFFGNI